MRTASLSCSLALMMVVGCGGSPSAPTSPTGGRDTPTHTIAAGSLTVQFWFVFDPPRNATAVLGQSYTIEMHCRTSQPADYRLTGYFDPLRPDGSVVSPRSPSLTEELGATNVGIDLSLCAPGRFGRARGQLPVYEPFAQIPQVRIRMWLRAIVPGSTSPNFSPFAPDLVVHERVNWTCQSPFTGPRCTS